MNETLKAVLIEVTGGNVRNHHINLRGPYGLFPDDSLGGSNGTVAGDPISLQIGPETIDTDIHETKAFFRERGAIRRFFERESVVEGDLVLIERSAPRIYRVLKASKRAFNLHL